MAKKILAFTIKILPVFFFLPLTGITVLQLQNLLLIYFGDLFCILYAGNRKEKYESISIYSFIFLLAVMLILRVVSIFISPMHCHVHGFYKDKTTRIYYILFGIISLLMLISFQISFVSSINEDNVGKICGLIMLFIIEIFIIFFRIQAILNTSFYNVIMQMEEMYLQKVF